MANPYPIAIADADSGIVKMAGAATFTDPANQPGGSQSVGCVLARDALIDIHAVGNADVLWDALYDNLWDLDPLGAIPAGLGLTFAFDGSSSLVVPTVAGFWTLAYFAARGEDGSWAGSFVVGGVGLNFPWVQAKIGEGAGTSTSGTPYLAASLTTPLPSGTQLTHQIATTNTAADATASKVSQVYLSIVRHA